MAVRGKIHTSKKKSSYQHKLKRSNKKLQFNEGLCARQLPASDFLQSPLVAWQPLGDNKYK